MEVPVMAGAALTLGTTRRLFSAAEICLDRPDVEGRALLDIAADGRFLIARRSSEDPRRGLLLVENWLEEFRER